MWLHELLGTTDISHDETHYTIAGAIRDRRRQPAGSIVLGKVCEPCNGGWMSSLEVRTAAILKPILSRGTVSSGEISSPDAVVVATWAWKTAMVRNRAVNYRHVVPDSHFHHLFKHGTIPPGVFVDLAIAPSHEGLSAIQSQQVIAFFPHESQEVLKPALRSVYNVVLAVGPLLLRVVYIPWLNYSVFSAVGPQFPSTVRLWPHPQTTKLDVGVFASDLFDLADSAYVRGSELSSVDA